MDEQVATFLAFTGTDDAGNAARYLDIAGGNIELAVQLFMESRQEPTNDEEVASRLQNEAYLDVREADADVHRHDTLVDNFGFQMPTSHESDMFGTGRVGVFNQRYNDEFPQIEELSDSDSDIEVTEVRDTMGRRLQLRGERMGELTLTQRRLALLFRPPFDLIERTNLEGARALGRQLNKWVLINIQDQTEFQCQVMNRDFWLNAGVKAAVKRSFVFLQYQLDSPNGESYSNFYHLDGCPHLSILDPITGERVHKWTDGVVPDVDEWLADIELFLEKFSLNSDSHNPVVKHEARIDPDAMTEEQQIEYAMKQSMGAGAAAEAETEAEADSTDFASLIPQDHEEPATGATRIQVRFPNGKRLVHKFDPNDTIRTLAQWLKYVVAQDGYGVAPSDRITLSSVGKPRLLDTLDQTLTEAGLKNASVLLEKE